MLMKWNRKYDADFLEFDMPAQPYNHSEVFTQSIANQKLGVRSYLNVERALVPIECLKYALNISGVRGLTSSNTEAEKVIFSHIRTEANNCHLIEISLTAVAVRKPSE